MKKVVRHNVPLWQFENLSQYPEIGHYVSGREGGKSFGALGSLNLSYKVNDVPENVSENRKRLADALSVTPGNLIFPVQTHSNHVRVVGKDTGLEELEDTDAIITNTPGLLISVQSADCVPVLLYDPVQKAAAAIHAGWRGTMAQIVHHTVEKMKTVFGSAPDNLIAAIGPSIGEEVYQVGPEVIEAVVQVYGTKEGIISREAGGKGFCNLWEANRIQLLRQGIKAENIEVAGICTYRYADQFFSARHSNHTAGRFAAGVVLKENSI